MISHFSPLSFHTPPLSVRGSRREQTIKSLWSCQGHAGGVCPPNFVEIEDFAWKLNSLYSSLLSIYTKWPFEANQNSAKVAHSLS